MTTTSARWHGTTSVYFPTAVKKAAIGLLLLGGVSVTWTGMRLPGLGDPSDLFIVLSFGICALLVVFGDLRFVVPLWTFIPVAAIVACVLVRQLDPPPFYLQVLRFQFGLGTPDSLVKAVFWLFALLVVPLTIIACTTLDHRVAVWAMGAYATGTAISSGVAIMDLTGLTNIGRSLSGNLTHLLTNSTVDTSNRIPGLTDHPNSLGFTATVSIPLAVYFMAATRLRWMGTILLIALFGGILASGSRGAQMLSPVMVLASLLWLPKQSTNGRSVVRFVSLSALVAAVVGVVVLLSLPHDIRDSILRVTSFGSLISASNASDTGRLTLIGQGLQDWLRYPVFGAGIRHIVEAHDIYVQLLASGGLVLLLAMFGYWFAMMRDCWRLSRIGIEYARFLMLSIAGWLFLGMVENQLTERGIYFAVGCVASLASVYLVRSPDASRPADSGRT